MRIRAMRAGDERVKPLYQMGKAVVDQEIKCAVGDRRLLSRPLGAQMLKNVIGAQYLVFVRKIFRTLRQMGVNCSAFLAQCRSAALMPAVMQPS
jgi:hypothetical protein